ncbi:MAG: cadherin-like domain-containing protein, partial [Pseudomonadota bacterium]
MADQSAPVAIGSIGFSAEKTEQVLNDPGTRVVISENNRLAVITPDGLILEIPAADQLVTRFAGEPAKLLNYLDDNRDALVNLAGSNGASWVIAIGNEISPNSTAAQGPQPQANGDDQNSERNNGESASSISGPQDGRAVSGLNGQGFSSLAPLGGLSDTNLSQVAPLRREDAQFGRDDIKRGEVGSAGQDLTVGTGASIGHLTGLGDEEPGVRNGEKLSDNNNTRFTGIDTGVGTGVDHLWLLGDFEYYRAADDFLSVDDVLPDFDTGAPAFGPLLRTDFNFEAIEDINYTDRLFDPTARVNATGITSTMDPNMGTVVIRPDGTFTYTPRDGFSGDAMFTFTVTDPRTGEMFEQDVTIAVAAVADPVQISGQATVLEDNTVNTPVDVTLFDLDGSETIETAVITGIPTGAVFNWNTALPTSVALQPDGSYIITGDTQDILDTLQSFTFLPPDDFSGQIVLGVDVTTIESNVPPGTTILTERATVHHDYVIDVIPDADVPDVTGDIDGVTPEDTRILLDDLAGNLNDLDGSEVLTYEISGVDADATLENTAGTEFAFTVQPDGTKTYTIPVAQIGDVFFDPPA